MNALCTPARSQLKSNALVMDSISLSADNIFVISWIIALRKEVGPPRLCLLLAHLRKVTTTATFNMHRAPTETGVAVAMPPTLPEETEMGTGTATTMDTTIIATLVIAIDTITIAMVEIVKIIDIRTGEATETMTVALIAEVMAKDKGVLLLIILDTLTKPVIS